MKKLFVSKSFMKKIALVLAIIILFQVIVSRPVEAGVAELGGTLLSPIVNLVMFLADGVVSILQNSLTDAGEPFTNISLSGREFNIWHAIGVIVIGVILVVAAVVLTVVSYGTAWAAIVAVVAPVLASAGVAAAGAGVVLSFNPQIGATLFDVVFGDSLVYSNIFITPEALLKNQIPLFDVNFFTDVNANGNPATSTLANTIRGIISGVYRTVRDLCIIAMLIIIVYIVIRMLISLTPREKSRYKEGFTNCLVGLVLIIGMHYIMSISTALVSEIANGFTYGDMIYECDDPNNFDVNQAIANNPDIVEQYTTGRTIGIKGENIYYALINDDGSVKEGFDKVSVGPEEKSVAIVASNFLEIARYKAQEVYSVDSEGENKQQNWNHIGWAFAYIMLVVLTVAFVWMYAKRLLYMAALTIFAPIVGVMYPINKADGSRAQTLNMWLKEYAGNLIIQPFHMLLYSILIGGAMYMAIDNPVFVIIALIGLNFIEKLVKDLVGIQDTRAGSLGNALRDTNRAIKTATNATKNAARSAGRMVDKGINTGLRAAGKLGKNGKDGDGKEEDENQKPPKEIGSSNNTTGTEEAKKDAEQDPFEQKDKDPYLVDKSFKKTDDFGLDEGNDLGIEGDLDGKPESLYDSDDEWKAQLIEQGWSEEDLNAVMGSGDASPEPLTSGIDGNGLNTQPDSLYNSDDEIREQLRAQGLSEAEIDEALRIRNASTAPVDQLASGMDENGIDMVEASSYMSGTSIENTAAIGAGTDTGIVPDDAEIAAAKSQLPKPPEFLDVETMSRINEARMEGLRRNGGTEVETSSGLKGVVSKDGGVIAADFTKLGQKKGGGTPKSADAKANQIPMQNAVGQNANVNNVTRTVGGSPKLSVVTPQGTSSSLGSGGSSSSSGASAQSTSTGNVSKVAYKGGTSAPASSNGTAKPKLEVVQQGNSSQSPQVSAPRPQVAPQVSAPEPQAAPQVSAPEPQVAPQVSAPEPQAAPQVSAPEPQVAPQVSAPSDMYVEEQENRGTGTGENIASGVVKAASVAGSVVGTAGKVTGNIVEGVLNMAVDGMTGNTSAIVNDAVSAVTGSSAAISDAGGRAVSSRGQGQLSDDAQYLMREGNTEERAQYVEAFCQKAREKGVVIDTKEDKRGVARALKDIGDKKDKTINSLILEAIKHKRAGRTKEDYEKYIDSKGVSSSVKNALLRLYDDARK